MKNSLKLILVLMKCEYPEMSPTFVLLNTNTNSYFGILWSRHFEPSCPNGRRIHGLCNVFFSEEFVPKEPCCLVIRNAIKSSFAR